MRSINYILNNFGEMYMKRVSVFLCLFLTVFTISSRNVPLIKAQPKKEQVHLTLFVHGPIFLDLAFINLKKSFNDHIAEKNFYAHLIKEIRTNPILERERFLFKLGFHIIEPETIDRFYKKSLTEAEKLHAGNLISASYHLFNQKLSSKDTTFVYATYGHLGLLNQKYRQQTAKELYDWLFLCFNQFKNLYNKVTIDLVGHDDGGNILLNLASHQTNSLRDNKSLTIDNLLFDCPLRVDTAQWGDSNLFKRIINIYTDQKADLASTKLCKNFKKFNDPELDPLEKNVKVVDLRLIINKKSVQYDQLSIWDIKNTSESSNNLTNLPFVIFTPMIISLLNETGKIVLFNHRILGDLAITDLNENLSLTIKLNNAYFKKFFHKKSANFYSDCKFLQELIGQQPIVQHKSEGIALKKNSSTTYLKAVKNIITKVKKIKKIKNN